MFKKLLFVFVFLFTFVLRAHSYDRIPSMGHLEELLFGWSGLNLLQTGTPMSWSTLDYPKETITYTGKVTGGGATAYVDMIKPWLDEPPLYSILSAAPSYFYKDNPNDLLPTSHIRIISVIIGTISSVFIFLLANRLFGYWFGITAMGLWGTVPLLVFSQRLSVPENMISLCLLVLIYLYYLYRDKKIHIFTLTALTCILTFIAGFSKPTGIFIAPFIAYLVFRHKKWLPGIIMILSSALPLIAFAIYGHYYDWELFKHIVTIQGTRPAGYSAFAFLLSSPGFDISNFFDGTYIFLFIGAIFMLFKKDKKILTPIKLAFVYWIFIVLLSGGQQDMLPWYRYPFFPFMVILGTYFLYYLYKINNFFSTFLVLALFWSSRYYLANAFHSDVSPNIVRIITFLAMLPSIAYTIFPQKKILKGFNRLMFILIIIFGFYLNSRLVYTFYNVDCENKTCSMSTPTWLSKISFLTPFRIFMR